MLKSTTEVANESYVAGWIPRLNQTAVSVPLAQGVMDVVRVVEAQLREHLGVERDRDHRRQLGQVAHERGRCLLRLDGAVSEVVPTRRDLDDRGAQG